MVARERLSGFSTLNYHCNENGVFKLFFSHTSHVIYMRETDAKTTPPADAFLDPDEVVAEDGKETDETFFWKVCVLCEAHMRRSETFGKGR